MKNAFDGVMIILIILFVIIIIVSLLLGVSKEWIFAFLTAILSVLGWIYSNAKNSQREVEARLFSEKAALYKKIFSLFPDMVKKIKLAEIDSTTDDEDDTDSIEHKLMEKMIDIKAELLIWGSEKTIRSWVEMENSAADLGEDLTQTVLSWGKLYSCMRADLGHSDYLINERDLIGIFLDAEARREFLN